MRDLSMHHCALICQVLIVIEDIQRWDVPNYYRVGHATVNSLQLPKSIYQISHHNRLKMHTNTVHRACSIKKIHKNISSYFWICSIGLCNSKMLITTKFLLQFYLNYLNSQKSQLKKGNSEDFPKLMKIRPITWNDGTQKTV